METSEAFDVFQLSTAPSPGLIAVGVTVMSAVGAGAETVGGGGGGGAGFFLWHPATVKSAARLTTETMYLR
jgi:hypothetical protein